jgi:ADP-ribosylglycohydrolase
MCNVLLGTAIGDALGVPFETKLVNYQPLIDWDGITYLGSEHHKLLPGQYSDDTQMSLMVSESLIESSGFNPDDLAKRYVNWITSGAARGYGKTTLQAVNNLLAGKHWSESGVVGSQGNGTAMRAAPFGVFFRNDLYSLVNILKIDSAITHLSEEAEAGAIAIGMAAALAVNHDLEGILPRITEKLPDSKIKRTLSSLDSMLESNITPPQVLRVLGTKANVAETVPSAIYCFLKFDNYHEAVVAAIKAGGDTDTTAAIVGALFGAKSGMKAINKELYSVEDFDKLVSLDSQLYSRSNTDFIRR